MSAEVSRRLIRELDSSHISQSEAPSKPTFRLKDLPWDCQREIVIHSFLRPRPVPISLDNHNLNVLAGQYPMFQPLMRPPKNSPLNLAATCRDYWGLSHIFYKNNTFTGRADFDRNQLLWHRQDVGSKNADRMTRWSWSQDTLNGGGSLDTSPFWITHLTLEMDATSPIFRSGHGVGYIRLIEYAIKAVGWRVELKGLKIDFKRGAEFENVLRTERTFKKLLKAADSIGDSGKTDSNWDMHPAGAAVYALEYMLWGSCKRKYFSIYEAPGIREELTEVDRSFLEDAMQETRAIVNGFNRRLNKRTGLMSKAQRKTFFHPHGMYQWEAPQPPTIPAVAKLRQKKFELERKEMRSGHVQRALFPVCRQIRFADAAIENQYWEDFVRERRFWFSPQISKFLRRAEEDIAIAVGMLSWGLIVRNLFQREPIWVEAESTLLTVYLFFVAVVTVGYCLEAGRLSWTKRDNLRFFEERSSAMLYFVIFCNTCLLPQGVFFLQPMQWTLSGSSPLLMGLNNSDTTPFDSIYLGLSLFGSVAGRIAIHLVFVLCTGYLFTVSKQTPLVRKHVVFFRWVEVFTVPLLLSLMEKMIPGLVAGWDCILLSMVVLTATSVTHFIHARTSNI